eukprot:1149393-Pelagomonas_calceolata.AAC.1
MQYAHELTPIRCAIENKKTHYNSGALGPRASRNPPDPHKQTSSHPDSISVVPTKRVPRTNSQYLLRSRGGRGGNREHSVPATATPPTSEV